jgi:hypothetical protein
VLIMLDCNECLSWARKKKEEIHSLVTDRVCEERLDNLQLRKMDSIGDYILGVIQRTETDIEYIKGNENQPSTSAPKVGFLPDPATATFEGNHCKRETPIRTPI